MHEFPNSFSMYIEGLVSLWICKPKPWWLWLWVQERWRELGTHSDRRASLCWWEGTWNSETDSISRKHSPAVSVWVPSTVWVVWEQRRSVTYFREKTGASLTTVRLRYSRWLSVWPQSIPQRRVTVKEQKQWSTDTWLPSPKGRWNPRMIRDFGCFECLWEERCWWSKCWRRMMKFDWFRL